MDFQLMDIQRFTMSGQKELDTQQIEFIERGNRYIHAYNSKNISQALESTIIYLSDYTRKHFATQEAFMQLHNYPGIEKHIAHHNEYVREVAKAFKMLLQYKSSSDEEVWNNLSTNVAMLIVDWFEFHLLQADKRLNEFIKYELKAVR